MGGWMKNLRKQQKIESTQKWWKFGVPPSIGYNMGTFETLSTRPYLDKVYVMTKWFDFRWLFLFTAFSMSVQMSSPSNYISWLNWLYGLLMSVFLSVRVDYVDGFGRSRRCMKKDLPHLMKQDQKIHENDRFQFIFLLCSFTVRG